ncbi:MAG: hypothetical protein E7312_04965 [Clostridiales bacterium]|nr:hypothetical protein [Clostridiales bacterium]
MNIKILNLYPELMNLYGERGNIMMLERRLVECGAEVAVINVAAGEMIQLDGIDLVYMSCGTESASLKALECLKPYKKELLAYIEAGKVMLLTGNALELFGESISTDGNTVDGLGIFTYKVERTLKKRFLGDCIFTMSGFDSKVIGFVNKCSKLSGVTSPLFNVEMGLGNDNKVSTEGFIHKNVYATSLIGPLLVRNPHLLKYIMSTLYTIKGQRVEFNCDMSTQFVAYDVALGELEAVKASKG